ncbi:MAG TPA: outer membrane beta-barrel protein, partial [Flavisolibacter sp.]
HQPVAGEQQAAQLRTEQRQAAPGEQAPREKNSYENAGGTHQAGSRSVEGAERQLSPTLSMKNDAAGVMKTKQQHSGYHPGRATGDHKTAPGYPQIEADHAATVYSFAPLTFRADPHPNRLVQPALPSPSWGAGEGRSPVNNTAVPAAQPYHRWYYGILAGPGFNSVRSGSLNKAGFDAGILGGYNISRRWSVEAGVFYTKNFYEARAEAFDTKAIASMLTGGRELQEVHGSNKLLEVPLAVRYFTGPSRRVFVSAGFSSYLMTEESNWYLTTNNGTNEMLYGEYRTRKPYFAAVITAGAGYERPIGKNTIRFQPYLQMPVQGVGVGNLRMVSTGLHIGLIRSSR